MYQLWSSGTCIIHHTHISICKGDIMTYVVLLQHLGVQHCDPEAPHKADHIEDGLISPELSLQHVPQVVLK